jgi:hypothetical protein
MKRRQRQPIGPFLGEFETTLLEGGPRVLEKQSSVA